MGLFSLLLNKKYEELIFRSVSVTAQKGKLTSTYITLPVLGNLKQIGNVEVFTGTGWQESPHTPSSHG